MLRPPLTLVLLATLLLGTRDSPLLPWSSSPSSPRTCSLATSPAPSHPRRTKRAQRVVPDKEPGPNPTIRYTFRNVPEDQAQAAKRPKRSRRHARVSSKHPSANALATRSRCCSAGEDPGEPVGYREAGSWHADAPLPPPADGPMSTTALDGANDTARSRFLLTPCSNCSTTAATTAPHPPRLLTAPPDPWSAESGETPQRVAIRKIRKRTIIRANPPKSRNQHQRRPQHQITRAAEPGNRIIE